MAGSTVWKNFLAPSAMMMLLCIIALIVVVVESQTSLNQQEIVVQPKDTNAIRGELATLYCTIVNQAGVPSWSKDGVIIAVKPVDTTGVTTGDHRWAIFGDESAGEFNLQIVNVDDSDAGVYTCNISQPSSSSSTSGGYLSSQPATLHVIPPPDGDFPVCLISIEGTLEVGEAVEFTCAFKTDNNQVQLYWTKQDDASFTPTSPETHVRNGFIVSQFYHSITRNDHLSTFQCIAESPGLPSARSCTTGFIVVRHVPDVTLTPASPSVRRGDSVTFSCLIKSSYPAEFTYSWTYQGLAVGNFPDKITQSGTQITVKDVEDSDDSAVVGCEAVNEVGSSRATAMISIVESPSQNSIYTWVIPLAIVVVIIVIILIIIAVVLECKCCCRRYVRAKKLTANGWTAEQFVMETRLHMPQRRGSDSSAQLFTARDRNTPTGRASSRAQPQRNQRENTSYIQETAIDNVGQARHYGSFGVDQRKEQPRNGSSKMIMGYTEIDTPSPDRNMSPGIDSGLDYQSSLDDSRSPTPRIDSTPLYAQIRKGNRALRVGGSRLSVQERQHIMDEL